MNIVILGYIVRGPLGGLAWHHLQYVLGLKNLAHHVLFLEDSDDFPGCYNPETFELGTNPVYGLTFLNDLFSQFDLKGQWAYYDAHSDTWFGNTKQQVLAFCSKADVVLNLSAVNPIRSWWASVPCRVYLDTDPAFTQIRHLTDPSARNMAMEHNRHFSFAENIGNKDCFVPDDGFLWETTRQPVFLDVWNIASPMPSANWTTVMQWDSYKMRHYNGQTFGMKSLSFQNFENLPQVVSSEIFELALGSSMAPADELKQKGWKIINSLIPTKNTGTYKDYIKQSKGEWSVSKHGYVISNSGWFSERSCNYLASGKPVIVQETGFSKNLQTGHGLFSFTTVDEAIDAINKVNKDYIFHCRGARRIAEEYFDSRKVLYYLLECL